MIIYDFKCDNGHRFEAALTSMFDSNPSCVCGAITSRIPSRVNRSGSASAGPSREDMPTTWRGTMNGNPEVLRGWHKAMTKREKLEEKYPELAGDRRPILAHEGIFANAPVRAGDAMAVELAKQTFGVAEPGSEPGTTKGVSA